MGGYLNPGNEKFGEALNSQIYVDKTGLIEYTNRVMYSNQKYVCVSRPRRFGKSMAANMLAAYYSRGCDSRELFQGLKISKADACEKKLNQYNTLFLNMQEFLSQTSSMDEMLRLVKKSVLWDLFFEYPDINYFDKENFSRAMQDVYQQTKCPFVIIIDEWDCIFREYRENHEAQEQYLDFLRDFLKDKAYIHLAYMTGILPIKKYGTHSALNMFDEFSMTNPGPLAEFVGFTEEEVAALCKQYGRNLSELKEWYDGYHFEKARSIYSPRSVVTAILTGICDSYWNRTETFEALRFYIDMNFEGLKDDVLSMLAGERIPVNTGTFSNDMTTFYSEDDVLTLLIHLGYLGYDFSYQVFGDPVMSKYDTETVEFTVQEGQNLSDIASALEHAKLIKYKAAFEIRAKLEKLDNKLSPGTYELSKSMTADQMLVVLTTTSAANNDQQAILGEDATGSIKETEDSSADEKAQDDADASADNADGSAGE